MNVRDFRLWLASVVAPSGYSLRLDSPHQRLSRGVQYEHLTQLANLYAHHVGRSLMTVAKRVGVHNKTFVLLKQGRGCHFDTFTRAVDWFDANWPADLEWPDDVPRQSSNATRRKGRAA